MTPEQLYFLQFSGENLFEYILIDAWYPCKPEWWWFV